MITIKLSELNKIKMSVNPPECVVKADYKVILNGMVKQYIGIGWIDIAQQCRMIMKQSRK